MALHWLPYATEDVTMSASPVFLWFPAGTETSSRGGGHGCPQAMMLSALAVHFLRWLPHATPGDEDGERGVAAVARDAGLHFSACEIRLSASSVRCGQAGQLGANSGIHFSEVLWPLQDCAVYCPCCSLEFVIS